MNCMINSKSFYVIDAKDIKGDIHVVGCGATGSRVVENLVRLNLSSKIIVYDFDTVEEINLNNQAYLREHIGTKKVEALKDLASKIDNDCFIRTVDSKVEELDTSSEDVVVILTDNIESRISILEELSGMPLVITGGINSFGGNIETVRGRRNYKKLIEEYENMDKEEEPAPGEYTPCGSPISIYHRIGTIASLMVEEIVKNINNNESMFTNVMVDVPNKRILK